VANEESTIITLAVLAASAVGAQFDRELERALENIRDPNTPMKGARTVTLTLTLAPMDEEREQIGLSHAVKVKLAGPRAMTKVAFIGSKDGHVVASVFNPQQLDGLGKNDVLPLNRAAGAKE